jgi:hypothetical protein
MTNPTQRKERVWNDPPLEPQKVGLGLHFEFKWICISLAMNTVIAVYVFFSANGVEEATTTDIIFFAIAVILNAILISPLLKYLIEGILATSNR